MCPRADWDRAIGGLPIGFFPPVLDGVDSMREMGREERGRVKGLGGGSECLCACGRDEEGG